MKKFVLEKSMNIKKPKKKSRIEFIIGSIFIPILLYVFSMLFQSGENKNIENNGENNGIIGNTVKAKEINLVENKNPTITEEKNSEYNQKNINKIHSFFDNLNEDDDWGARKNIYKDLSKKFTNSLIGSFCSHSDKIRIENVEEYGPINNDEKIVISYYKIKINYFYDSISYKDEFIIGVRMNPNDKLQHHISSIDCDTIKGEKGPFCNFFGI